MVSSIYPGEAIVLSNLGTCSFLRLPDNLPSLWSVYENVKDPALRIPLPTDPPYCPYEAMYDICMSISEKDGSPCIQERNSKSEYPLN
jgi:hypothetical protein